MLREELVHQADIYVRTAIYGQLPTVAFVLQDKEVGAPNSGGKELPAVVGVWCNYYTIKKPVVL